MRFGFLRAALNIAALAGTIVVNWLSNALPLNGKSTEELSDLYPVLTTPAGYAFSIWGLIYLALIGFAVYQALPSQRSNPTIDRITPLFLVSCVANVGWLFTWHYELLLPNILLMLMLLVTLIGIYRQLRADGTPASTGERWLLRAPFSMYLGWITVATIVNLSTVLYAFGWRDVSMFGQLLAALLFVVAGVLGFSILRKFDDPVYTSVIIWALVGVAVKQPDSMLVAGTALLVAVLLALSIAYRLVTRPAGEGRLSWLT